MTAWPGLPFTTVRFLDTNILLYLVSTEEAESDKQASAREIVTGSGASASDLGLSTQVLGEFYVQATRATKSDPLSHDQAQRLVRSFTRFTVQSLTQDVVLAALATRDRFQVSYWDAAIIEASRALGATTVVSEDLQDGMDFAGVTVHNPFL